MRVVAAALCVCLLAMPGARAADAVEASPTSPDPFQMAPAATAPKAPPRPHSAPAREEELSSETIAAPPPPPVVDDPSATKLTRIIEHKSAQSGGSTRIGRAIHVEPPRCQGSLPTIRVLQQPAHGTINSADEPGTIPTKTAVGSPGKCAGQPIVGRVIYYQSEAGYKGSDNVTYEEINHRGGIILRVISLTVE